MGQIWRESTTWQSGNWWHHPKKLGGAGFTNTRVMNKCLLAKWIFKIERERW
jgi:hypothetical protein